MAKSTKKATILRGMEDQSDQQLSKNVVSKKSKVNVHKTLIKKRMQLMNDNFLFNRLLSNDIANEALGIEPFTFGVTIKASDAITIRSIAVHGKRATEADIKVKDGNIVATVKSFVATSTFVLSIEAEGTPFAETTFNLTCDGDKVFGKDQEITIQSSRRGGYFNDAVKIP